MRALLHRLAWVAGSLILAAAIGALAWSLSRPDIRLLERTALKPGKAGAPGAHVALTYFGVSTVIVGDGDTRFIIDGYFTRLETPLDALFNRLIESDEAAVTAALKRHGIDELAAVFVQHSHFDHALDAPTVAAATGAVLFGSPTTANIARGAGLAERQIAVLDPGEPICLGRFEVTPLRSKHVALPIGGDTLGAELTKPLAAPARLWDYIEGGTYAFLIRHPAGTVLFHGSAAWLDRMYEDRAADVVLLGVGGLGPRGEAYLRDYVTAVADASGAERVIPVHFEDLFAGAGAPKLPPRGLGEADRLLARLKAALGARYATLRYGKPTVVLRNGDAGPDWPCPEGS